MCGHVGVASKLAISKAMPLHKAFKEQLYLDAIRGWDATGICSVSMGGSKTARIRKKAIPAHDFLRQDATDAFLNPPSKLLIGHNRAATSGKIDDRSSHPFTHAHITMAHNGTLYSHDDLPRKRGVARFVVDSEAVCHALSVTDDTKAVLEQLDGAFALVWYDQRDDTLNFARNDDRPFYYATDVSGSDLLWASDEHLLSATIERKLAKVFTITELSPGEHLSFDMNIVDFNTPNVHTFQPAPDYWSAYTRGGSYSYTSYTPTTTAVSKRMTKWGYEEDDMITFTVTSSMFVRDSIHEVEGIDEATGLRVVARNARGLSEAQKGDVVTGFLGYLSIYDPGATEDSPIILLKALNAYIKPLVIEGECDNTVTELSLRLADGSIMYADEYAKLSVGGCGWCGDVISSLDAWDLVSVPEYDCLMHEQCANQCELGDTL